MIKHRKLEINKTKSEIARNGLKALKEQRADSNQEGERASGKAAEASKRSVERGGGASVCHGDSVLRGARF